MTGEELADLLHHIGREVYVRDPTTGQDLAVLRVKTAYGQPVRLICAVPVPEEEPS